MGRKKISIEPIEEDRNRHVTFMKRKNGLFKKAMELSILCKCEMALIIFDSNNQLYEFCSHDPRALLQKYCQIAHSSHERLMNVDYDTKYGKNRVKKTAAGKGKGAAASKDSDDEDDDTQPVLTAGQEMGDLSALVAGLAPSEGALAPQPASQDVQQPAAAAVGAQHVANNVASAAAPAAPAASTFVKPEISLPIGSVPSQTVISNGSVVVPQPPPLPQAFNMSTGLTPYFQNDMTPTTFFRHALGTASDTSGSASSGSFSNIKTFESLLAQATAVTPGTSSIGNSTHFPLPSFSPVVPSKKRKAYSEDPNAVETQVGEPGTRIKQEDPVSPLPSTTLASGSTALPPKKIRRTASYSDTQATQVQNSQDQQSSQQQEQPAQEEQLPSGATGAKSLLQKLTVQVQPRAAEQVAAKLIREVPPGQPIAAVPIAAEAQPQAPAAQAGLPTLQLTTPNLLGSALPSNTPGLFTALNRPSHDLFSGGIGGSGGLLSPNTGQYRIPQTPGGTLDLSKLWSQSESTSDG